jgi:predicted negative regulator of RcsB-dependent stress response
MSTYQTDDEQVEAIKKWWKENGKSVIGGVVLGFAIIGGWQWWQVYHKGQGEAASLVFDTMRQAVRLNQVDKALEDGRRLLGDYPGSAYAGFAALEMARLSYERGEKDAARGHLQWVIDSAADPSIAELARLRLGRLLLDIQDTAALSELLAKSPLPAFDGEFAALRGDLARAQGDLVAARDAYQQAMLAGVEDQTMLRMKLVDVGGTAPAS